MTSRDTVDCEVLSASSGDDGVLHEPVDFGRDASGSRALRIAVVVQRYGLEINGGAELHARLIVGQLRQRHAVTVLTSRAKDYTVWDSAYPSGEAEVDGIAVIRFDHPQRGHTGRARVMFRHLIRYRLRKALSALGITRVAQPTGDLASDGELTLERQGPWCPGLVDHLRRDAVARYDLVIFFTALHFPTSAGLRACPVPSILVPTLHDERMMYLPLFHQVFRKPDWILWNCEAERRLSGRLYGDGVAPGSICGVGIEVAPVATAVLQAVLAEHGVDSPYFLFVGRVSRSKGFAPLLRAYQRLRSHAGPRVQLVVVGQSFMAELPQMEGLVYTGFVDDAARDALMAGALATVVSSRHESLSLVTLESMAHATPVVVNGRSDVLRAHVADSGAGLVYDARLSLTQALRQMRDLTPERRQQLGEAGRAYVELRYTWTQVRRELFSAVERVAAGRLKAGAALADEPSSAALLP